jgi:chorismate mutase/prephenate dehydratase
MAQKKITVPARTREKSIDSAMKSARFARVDSLPRTLGACRREIDKVDETIIALLDRRARIARKVGELKAKDGGDFFDAGRHLSVLNGITRRGKGDFPPEGLRNVYGEILSVCLNLQAPQTIAYLGPEGTYSHIAARRAFGRSPIFAPYESIPDIFLAVEKNWAHFGIAPVENSTGGVIHATLDELMGSELSICAEVYTPIRHNLMCLGPRKEIQRIATHPQVLSQCRIWLRENMPGIKLIETPSTAEGAQLAQKDKATATIGSQMISELYKLPILERGIEDQKDNVTRFIVIGKQRPRPSGNDRTSVMFSIKDEPGALYHLLKPFADKKINLTKIESRPTRRRAWDYIFFVDVEGHISSKEVQRAIDRLKKHCTFLRVLGSYPVDRHQDNG